MDVNNLFSYSGESDTCLETQKFKEIVNSIGKVNVGDEVGDDTISLEPITHKEMLIAFTTLHILWCSSKRQYRSSWMQ